MKMKSILLASVVAAAAPSLAMAQEPMESWYLSLGAGVNSLDEVDGILTSSGGVTTDFAIDFETGWAFGGAVGYHWDMLRLELELSYRENDASDFEGAATTTGDVSQFAQMLNIIFDIPLGESVELSLGAGIGGALVDADITATTLLGTAIVSDDDYVLAYQAIAGLSVDVGERTELFAEYRYFVADGAELNGDSVPGPTFVSDDYDMKNHTGLFGLRYYFGEAAAEPMESAPAPAAEPAPQTSYTVYFDFNKSNLTAEGQAAVAEAVEARKSSDGPVTIDIQGDGDASMDAKLADRRAAAVKAAAVNLGAPADSVSVETRDGGDATVTLN